MKVLMPPAIEPVDKPVVFLAGPIQGAVDWQPEAIKILQALKADVVVASPRREYLDGEFVYEKQVDWESHYLKEAGKSGVILFWLAKESVHYTERSYAQTTRFELAEWKVKHERDGAKLVIGIEEGYTGARYIRHRCAQDCPDVPIVDDLGEACQRAVDIILANVG